MGFPGEIAGASLKLASCLQERASFDFGFPGEIAGASLKQSPGVLFFVIVPPGFPGEIAGASLKLDLWLDCDLVELGDSPAKSPGPH